MNLIKNGPIFIEHALKMGIEDLRISSKGYPRFNGNAKTISRKIVKKCFNGDFLQGSLGHFKQPWARDIGMFSESLVNSGFKNELESTLEFLFSIYQKSGKITTTVFGRKHAVDVYDLASDTLPFLIHAILSCGRYDLLKKHQDLLSKEIRRIHNKLINDSSLVKKDIYVSGARDCVTRSSSTYDNSMISWLGYQIEKIQNNDIANIPNPIKHEQMKEKIKENLWTGKYFKEDLNSHKISGDANVWPFFIDLFEDEEMKEKALKTLKENELNKPFPLKYSKEKVPEKELLFPKIFTPNYQGDTIWTQLGLCYIDVLSTIEPDEAKLELNKIGKVIEKNGNVLELFEPNGDPYKGRFYRSDYGMILAILFLDLANRL